MIDGILSGISESYFWDNWESKMMVNYRKYIAPDSQAVTELANSLNILENQTHAGIAGDISDWIANNYDYKLEKRWRRPEETIQDQMGDCEDYTFLLASLLPHFGVDEFTIVAGEAITGSKSELHVWLEIDGDVTDPTADALQAQSVSYMDELRFDITIGDF